MPPKKRKGQPTAENGPTATQNKSTKMHEIDLDDVESYRPLIEAYKEQIKKILDIDGNAPPMMDEHVQLLVDAIKEVRQSMSKTTYKCKVIRARRANRSMGG